MAGPRVLGRAKKNRFGHHGEGELTSMCFFHGHARLHIIKECMKDLFYF